jgi:hypothetical protein
MKVEAHHLIHLLKWPPKVTQAFNQTHTCGTEMGDLGCIAVIPPQAFYLSTGVREVHSAGNIKSKRFAKKKKNSNGHFTVDTLRSERFKIWRFLSIM